MRKKTDRPDRRLGWLVVGLAVAAILAGAGFVRETLRARQIAREIRALQAEADNLRIRNFQVSSLQASLESGEFLEREARTKLGLQKEGEQVVVLRKDDAPSPKDEAGPVPRSLGEVGWTNPKKWWTYFADPHAFEDYVRSRNAAPAPTTSAAR